MQKKNSLRTDFYRSRAAEVASRKLCIMIESGNDLEIMCHNSKISLGWVPFKGKQRGCVCVCVPRACHTVIPAL